MYIGQVILVWNESWLMYVKIKGYGVVKRVRSLILYYVFCSLSMEEN